MTEHTAQDFAQPFCIAVRIIDAADQGVFKGDTASRFLCISSAGFQQDVQGISFVHRHHRPPDFISGSMQGDSQIYLGKIFSETINHVGQTASRHCDIAHADIEAVLVIDNLYECRKVIVVVKGLSCAHNHDMADFFASVGFRFHQLRKNLSWAQVAL